MVNTLTLNPAIDKVLYLPALTKNVTNRLTHTLDTIGGKGTHVSINLKMLGLNNRAFGIAYGSTGQCIIDLLEQYALDVRFLHNHTANSRTNYLLVEDNEDSTLLAEKGVQLTDEDLAQLLAKMQRELEDGDYLILAGDASNCADPCIYNKILQALKPKNLKVFLDTSGETLLRCLEEAPFLIKPNLDELSFLCGRPIGCTTDEVILAIDSLEQYKIDVIAVSLGEQGSIVKSKTHVYKAVPPKVRVVNTVGCGDSYMAGLVYGFFKELPMAETLKLATAVSAATAECPLSVGFDLQRSQELLKETQVTILR